MLYDSSGNSIHMRFLVVCLLGFAGYSRITQLLAVQTKTEFSSDVAENYPKSKTEQLKEGIVVFVYISQTGGLACPVYWLKLFLECFDLTAAAKNDVSDRLIGKHGRWSSNSSKDKYIKA